MWIVKGVLLGVVIFLVAEISYTAIRMRLTMYRLEQLARSANTGTSYYYQIPFRVRWLIHLIHQPIIWAAIFISIAIGIWIVRARATHSPAGSVDSTTQN